MNVRKAIAMVILIAMVSTSFLFVGASSTAHESTGYTPMSTAGIVNVTGSATLSAKESSTQQTWGIDSPTAIGSFNSQHNRVTYSTSTSIDVWGGQQTGLMELWIGAGAYYVNSQYWYYLSDIWANLTVDGHTFSQEFTAPDFSQYSLNSSSSALGIEIYGLWTLSGVPSGYYTVTLSVAEWENLPDVSYTYDTTPEGFITAPYTGTLEVASFITIPTQGSDAFVYGWTYSGATQSFSWTIYQDTHAETVSFSSPYSLVMTVNGDSTASGTSESLSFVNVAMPDSASLGSVSGTPSDPSFSVSWKASTTQIAISITPTPPDLSAITQSPVTFGISFTSSAGISEISAYVSGSLQQQFTGLSTSGSISFSYSDPSLSPELVTWEIATTIGYTSWSNYTYGGSASVPENASSVIVMQSATGTHVYPIAISGSPTGSGYYDQFFTLNNPSSYGLNTEASNFLIRDSTVTLNTWIQSYNSSQLLFWTKVPNGTTSLNMYVYPEFTDFFSATGNLGVANSTYDNGNTVFNTYIQDVTGTPFISPISSAQMTAGLTVISSFYSPVFTGYDGFDLAVHNYTGGNYDPTASVRGTADGGVDGGYYAFYYTGSNFPKGGTVNTYIQDQTAMEFVVFNSTEVSQRVITYSSGYYSWSNVSHAYNNGTLDVSSIGTGYEAWYIAYSSMSLSLMPSVSLSSGQPFMANATTSSSVSALTGTMYNSTWQHYTYDVFIGPSTTNVSILINPTWQIYSLSPSTYIVFQQLGIVTFTGVSGYVEVTISTIQPSQQIGTAAYLSLSYQYPSQVSPGVQPYTNEITYSDFGSSTQHTLNTSTASAISVPWGSTISVTVFNQWDQAVGSLSNVLIDQSSMGLSVFLNVTQINFDIYNGTNSVWIDVNGANYSFYNSVIVANGSLYQWTIEYYTPTTGSEFKTGTVQAYEQVQTLPIYLNAPPATLQVNINAYSGANLGTLTSGGNPRVIATINGQPYTVGSTFAGYEGTTYEIRIADLLNQTLLDTNYTVSSSFASITEDITTASYWMGIENDEAVPQNSPLATEFVSIHRTGETGPYFNFTDSIDQNWIGYFAAGNYTVYMHDNVTGTFYMNISDNNSQMYLFGQALLTYSEFESMMNQTLNYSKHAAGTAYGLTLTEITPPVSVIPYEQVVAEFGVYYANGSAVNVSFLQNSTVLSIIQNQYGALQSFSKTVTVSGNVLTVTLTPDIAGNFTLQAVIENGLYAGETSYSFSSAIPTESSIGMALNIIPAVSPYTNQTKSYQVQVEYGNSTLMNLSDTSTVFLNIRIELLQGSTVLELIAPTSYTAGYINFTVPKLATGQYELYVYVPQVTVGGQSVHASTTLTLDVSTQPVNSLQGFIQGLAELWALIVKNLAITILGVVAGALFTWGVRRLIRYLKHGKDVAQSVDRQMLTQTLISMTLTPIDSQSELIMRFSKLSEAQRTTFMDHSAVPDDVLAQYEVKYLGKMRKMDYIRSQLDHFNKSRGSSGVMELFSRKSKKEGEKQ